MIYLFTGVDCENINAFGTSGGQPNIYHTMHAIRNGRTIAAPTNHTPRVDLNYAVFE